MKKEQRHQLIPVTFAISGYVLVDSDTLEEANKKIITSPEDYAPVDAHGNLYFKNMCKLQYVDGSMEASYKTSEDFQTHKLVMLVGSLINDESIINTKTQTVFIPDISWDSDKGFFKFQGLNVKVLGKDEIADAMLENDGKRCISNYCLSRYPAAGTCAPDRFGWIPLNMKNCDNIEIRADLLSVLVDVFDDDIEYVMTESDYINSYSTYSADKNQVNL